ncbi:hypothetical protein ACFXHA_21790 [Nocardia sp. NPDC059240]|uniref:hypothetical protein n=1 Tax=Nocardia sp. NPDC059240 TaxID=3346786 RepID=UPI0036B43F2C
MSTVGKYFESTLIRGIDEGVGTPGVAQALHGTPRDGSLELMTGTPGDIGPQGEPGAAFRWEGDIADQAALAALAPRLGLAHAGKAWRVLATDTLMYWNGTSFDSFTDAFGASGPDGAPCDITIGTVATGPAGSALQATVTGTKPNLVLNLTVPQGVKGVQGAPGGPGPIRQAPDYADGPHRDRTVPSWNAAGQKWTPRPFPGLRGPWSIAGAQAWDGGPGFAPTQQNVGTTPNTIAQLRIPAQDVDWRPVIAGGALVFTSETIGNFNTRIDAEVRIDSDSGQIVALGAGFPFGADGFCYFQPHYATRAMTPDGAVGVIPAGRAVTLYVVLRRNRGDSNYTYRQGDSQILCWARPVTAS